MAVIHRSVEQAMDAILGAFIWSETTQGFDYWEEVYENLKEMLTSEDTV